MRNLECSRNASGCLRKTNTTTKGDLYPDAVKIVAASRPGPDESPGRGPLRHRGIFLPQRPRRLQPPPEMRTLGRGLSGRTHPARAHPAGVKRVLDNPARRSKFKIMKTCVPPGGATGRWAGTGERRLCRERFGSHYQTIGNNDGRKRNQNPFADTMAYPPFSLPNIC